jgi:hypothetical protein
MVYHGLSWFIQFVSILYPFKSVWIKYESDDDEDDDDDGFLSWALEAMPNRMDIKVTRSSTLKIYLDSHIVHV